MFWIGIIVGMILTLLVGSGIFAYCMYACGVSWEDYNNLVEANKAVLINRDSRIEVYDEDTDDMVFEAGFKYPWSDEEDE